MDFIESQILFLQFFDQFFACGFVLQKLLSLLGFHENIWITASQKLAFFCACILPVVHSWILFAGFLGALGGHILVVGPVKWVHKTHTQRTPKTQYNDLIFYSCRLGLQLTTMSDNLDFIYFYNRGHKWFQDCHSLFHLWFQAIHSLGYSWVQAGHSLVHLWFRANHSLIHLW